MKLGTMNQNLEDLALQGGTVALHFNPLLFCGKGAWVCTVTCEDKAHFEGVDSDSAENAVAICFKKAFSPFLPR